MTGVGVSIDSEIHMQRSRNVRKGRPTDGGLFTYEAIAAGTRFSWTAFVGGKDAQTVNEKPQASDGE